MARFFGASINSTVINYEKDGRVSRNNKLIKFSTSLKSLNEIKKDLLGTNEARKLTSFLTDLPPELNVEDLSELQQKNRLIIKENEELCNDIQDLIAENEDLFTSNERLKKMLDSQQEKINQLEEGLDDSLQAHQDEVSNKQVDSEFRLRFKLHAAVLENKQLKRAVQQLEQEQENMLETIKELMKEANSLRGDHIKGMQNACEEEFKEAKAFALSKEKAKFEDSTTLRRRASLSSLNHFRFGNADSWMQSACQKDFKEDKTFAISEEKTKFDDSPNLKRQASLSSLHCFKFGNADSWMQNSCQKEFKEDKGFAISEEKANFVESTKLKRRASLSSLNHFRFGKADSWMQNRCQKEFKKDKTFAVSEEMTNFDDSTNLKRQVSLSSLNCFRFGNADSRRNREDYSFQNQVRTDGREKLKPLQKILQSLPNLENSTGHDCDQFLVSSTSETQEKFNQDLPDGSNMSVERNSVLLAEFNDSVDHNSFRSNHRGKIGCAHEDFLREAEDNLLELQSSQPILVSSTYNFEIYKNSSKNGEDSSSKYFFYEELSDLSGNATRNQSNFSNYLNMLSDSGDGLLVGFGRTDD